MDHVYINLSYNPERDEFYNYSFHKTLYNARIFATFEATVVNTYNAHSIWCSLSDLKYICVLSVCVFIFKIPVGRNIQLDDISMESDIWEYYVETIYDRKTQAVKKIQRQFRIWSGLRNTAAWRIQTKFREAIANPYTQLCKNRLTREFKNLLKTC